MIATQAERVIIIVDGRKKMSGAGYRGRWRDEGVLNGNGRRRTVARRGSVLLLMVGGGDSVGRVVMARVVVVREGGRHCGRRRRRHARLEVCLREACRGWDCVVFVVRGTSICEARRRICRGRDEVVKMKPRESRVRMFRLWLAARWLALAGWLAGGLFSDFGTRAGGVLSCAFSVE